MMRDPELDLLGDDVLDDDSAGSAHAFKTAPVFTGDAFTALGESILPQRALYGRVIAQWAPHFPLRPSIPKLYINTNAPFSALVCGVQGSGKSHSTSVLLESCLMADERLGTLPAPLSALVFHFDTAAGGGAVQPCEAAYLAALDAERGVGATPPTVTVLVLPTNVQAMKRVYAGLPSVRVEPLHFSAEDISGERLLAMMKVDEGTQMPLYMEAIMSILRSMESNFNYTAFRDELKRQTFNSGQRAMLNLRLSLLDSCLEGGNAQNRVSSHFRRGHLTIIDLSSPFMDGNSACGFFDLILGLFVEADVDAAGKVVVLDEAHKYLSDAQAGTSARLTDSLLSVIRQQRHLATRVVISTQEPTVVPSKFIDLCSFIIAHRFSSPKWLQLLTNHVSTAGDSFDDLFAKIVSLRTGQAIMFAPNGLGVREGIGAAQAHSDSDSGVGGSDDGTGPVSPLGQGYLHVRSRLRVTRDGGHSILAVSDPESTTRIGRVPGGAGMGPTDPLAGWGSAHAADERAGGSQAPAEPPAEAGVPPEPHRSEAPAAAPAGAQSTWHPRFLETSSSSAAAPAFAPAPVQPPIDLPSYFSSLSAAPTAKASAAPYCPTASSAPAGDLSRFVPLMRYVLPRLSTTTKKACLGMKNIQSGFNARPNVYPGGVEQVVSEAVRRGLLREKNKNKKRYVMRAPNMDYRQFQ